MCVCIYTATDIVVNNRKYLNIRRAFIYKTNCISRFKKDKRYFVKFKTSTNTLLLWINPFLPSYTFTTHSQLKSLCIVDWNLRDKWTTSESYKKFNFYLCWFFFVCSGFSNILFKLNLHERNIYIQYILYDYNIDYWKVLKMYVCFFYCFSMNSVTVADIFIGLGRFFIS